MMKDDANWDRFERYHKGLLSEAEGDMLLDQLASDPELKRSFEAFQLAFKAAQVSAISGLKQKMVQTNRRRLNPSHLAWAASILALVTIGTLWWMQAEDPSRVNVVQSYLNEGILSAERSLGDDPATLRDVQKKIIAEDYRGALALMQSVEDSIKALPYFIYLRGLTTLRTDSPAQAIDDLENLVTQQDARFSDEAQWNLALAHLKNADEAACRRELAIMIADRDHDFREESMALLRQLDEGRRFFD